jgi:hypothetical protein
MVFLHDVSNPCGIYRRPNVDRKRQEANLEHDPDLFSVRPVHWVLGKGINDATQTKRKVILTYFWIIGTIPRN